MASPSILHIALNTPLRSLFDYKAPTRERIEPGQRVEVPFGTRKAVGLVVRGSDASEIPAAKLKPIKQIIDSEPSISKELLDFILWSANYYHHPIGEALFHALPSRLRENKALGHKDFFLWKPTEKGAVINLDKLSGAPKQAEALKAIQDHPEGLGPQTCKALGINSQSLKALASKELVYCDESPQPREKPVLQNVLRNSPLKLNEEQSLALRAINQSQGQYKSFLLEGVTGSGKTEVYLQTIEHVLSEGKQALVLVPEIGLTPQTLQRFQQRFSCEITSLHSGLTESQRYKNWHQAKNGQASIVIGTRSAIFSDLPKLGIIIVDEEHDLSYKQQEGFRYSARDLALVRAQREKIPVLLGSATPSFESLANASQGRYQTLTLTQRATQASEPKLQMIDIRGKERQGGLSQKTIQGIRKHLEQGEQVLVFINRRGYTPVQICSECSWTATCPYCDARFTYHKSKNLLWCHHCNFKQAPLNTCPQCHEGDMQAIGQGTEKVEEVLQQHFKKIPIIRVDKDSTEKRRALEERLAVVHKGEPCILVGTQMLAKGHHFPKVNLVSVLDFDQGFYSSDFRALERMAQTLIQIAGRAGRESQHGELLLQTELPDHPALQTLLSSGYRAFAEEALEERKLLNYPPFGHLCLLRADAMHIEESLGFLKVLKEQLESINIQRKCRILGPAPAPMQKRAGRQRAQLLLQSQSRAQLHQILNQALDQSSQIPTANKVRWSIDVDPLELF